MKKVVFLLGLILGGFLNRGYSQTLADTFQNFIPKSAAPDETTKRQISAQLAYLGEIHPDLIYHYFEFLNVQLAQPGSSPAQMAYRRFNTIKHHYEWRRQIWAKKQIEYLHKQNSPHEVIELAKRHLEKLYAAFTPYEAGTHSNFSAKTDSLNYLAIQYYQRNQRIDYVPERDYLSQRRVIEAKFRVSFSKTLANLSAIPQLSHHELIRKFQRYWHLYERPTGANWDSTFASTFLLAVEKHYYSLRDIPNDLVKPPRLSMVGGFYQNQTHRFRGRIPIVELNHLDLPFNKPTDFSQNLLSLQFRLPLRHYLTAFSYLKIQLAFLDGGTQQRFMFNNTLFTYRIVKDTTTEVTTTYTESATFTKGEVNIKLQKSYVGKLSVPFIVVNKHVALEVGVLFGKNTIAHRIQHNYHYRLVETKRFPNNTSTTTVLKDGESGNRVQNQTLTQWFASPSLSGVLQLPYRLTLEISLFEKYKTLMAGFTLF